MVSLLRGTQSRAARPGRRLLIRSSLLFGGAVAGANALTAVTQLVLARLLVPSEYSLVVTLFVVVTVAGVPLAALQATIARNVATALVGEGEPGAGAALVGAWRELGRLSVPLTVLVAAAAVPIAFALNVHRPWPLVATAVVVIASVALTVVWAGLQGTHRFGILAGGQLAFAAVKLAAAVAAAGVGAGVAGVMGGVAGATVATLVVGVLPLLPQLRSASHGKAERQALLTRYSGGAAAALTLFALLTTLDVAVARIALPASTAGAYAAASVVGRGLLLVPTAITTVLFPRVSTLVDKAREQRHLQAGLAATGAVGIVATLVLWPAGGTIVRLLFGARYGPAAGWVALLGAAMTLYGVAFVYLFHTLSVGRHGFWRAALPLAALQVAAFGIWHASGRQLALVQIGLAAVLVVAAELYHRRAA
jgi:O-antigen/teichoic acid export membrane protein